MGGLAGGNPTQQPRLLPYSMRYEVIEEGGDVDRGTACGHPLHPGPPPADLEEPCPVCCSYRSINWLKGLSSSWDVVGGPGKQFGEHEECPRFHPAIKNLWRQEKICVNMRMRLAGEPASEIVEDGQILPADRTLHTTFAASHEASHEEKVVGGSLDTPEKPHARTCQVTKVSFSDDVVESNERHLKKVKRASTYYTPGKHSCREKPGWAWGDPCPEYNPEEQNDDDTSKQKSKEGEASEGDGDGGDQTVVDTQRLEDSHDMEDLDEDELGLYIILEAEVALGQEQPGSALGRRSREEYESYDDDGSSSSEGEYALVDKRQRS
ncbi:hypothetical protein P154DRAFT_592384 [Amniculicola lignicola CBS 123094]|uniref:Uncharacterized protein n=1 Tax=Amniculicola lignicola CBS 123094 TaxID=1392246 RepID=A0A6A5X1S7_9PLEO|nr:hypothetical protein P154DRAFT_592384 [Amniculicola lignicola CBS 123094]